MDRIEFSINNFYNEEIDTPMLAMNKAGDLLFCGNYEGSISLINMRSN